MVSNTKRKSGLDSNAAYAASQPLFDALHKGLDRLEDQRSNLTTARSTVQDLHVKIVNENPHQAQSCHDKYMQSIVSAWRSAAEVYADIFQQLVDITAANPTEGRPASGNHNQFKALLKSTSVAQTTAARFSLAPAGTENANSTGSDEDGDSEESDSDSSSDISSDDEGGEAKAGQSAKPTALATNSNGKRPLPEDEAHESKAASKVPKSGESDFIPLSEAAAPEGAKKVHLRPGTAKGYVNGIKYSESGRELWKIGAKEPTVPYGTLGASERKAWKHEKKRQVREQKKEVQKQRKEAKRQKASENARAKKAAGAAKVTGDEDAPAVDDAAGVQYEDVSAEASARLKAKEEAKKAKNESLKRKRESTDSNIQVGDFYEDLGGAAPTTTPDASAKKPAGKRFKKTGLGANGHGVNQSTRGKRKRTQDDEGPKPAPPKRDKSKYNKATRKTGKYKRSEVTGANMTAVGPRPQA